MDLIFFLFLGLSVYSYVIYPLFLIGLSTIVRREWDKREISPSVSIVVSVHNEERVIEAKLRNTLALLYPKKFEVFVASDASTDRTDEIVRGFDDPRVILKVFSDRAGKTACLNRTVPETNGLIVVFTDANSMFPPNLLSRLTRHFADPEVGLVTGWTKYSDVLGNVASAGVYARLEKKTKVDESMISSCVGADGAVFAIRKSLFRELRGDDINDFVIPLQMIKQGKRVILDPEVFCLEEPTGTMRGEYHRQVRITTRTLRAIVRNLKLLNPFRFGTFSFFLFSHKIMRFLMPFFLILTFATNLVLLKGSVIYKITLAAQLAAVLIGIGSMIGLKMGRIGRLAKFLLMTLAAQFIAWFRAIAGVSDTIWTPKR